jgi:hypothetical protein
LAPNPHISPSAAFRVAGVALPASQRQSWPGGVLTAPPALFYRKQYACACSESCLPSLVKGHVALGYGALMLARQHAASELAGARWLPPVATCVAPRGASVMDTGVRCLQDSGTSPGGCGAAWLPAARAGRGVRACLPLPGGQSDHHHQCAVSSFPVRCTSLYTRLLRDFIVVIPPAEPLSSTAPSAGSVTSHARLGMVFTSSCAAAGSVEGEQHRMWKGL